MADLTETPVRAEGAESVPPESPSYFQRQPKSKWYLLVVILIALIGIMAVWHYFSTRESTDDAQIDGHINPVSARVGGTVTQVLVQDNQSVQAGQVLVQLDPRDYQVAVERAQADLANAQAAAQAASIGVPITTRTTGSNVSTSEARVEDAQAGVKAAQQEVDAARAQENVAQARLAEAQANYTKAARDLDRMKQLVAKDEISQQQYDAAVASEKANHATVQSARAQVASSVQAVAVARSHLVQARAQVAVSQAELHAAHAAPEHVAVMRARAAAAAAQVKEAQAALDQAQLNLQYTTVRAPVSGRVSKKTVEIGQIVQPGEPLMALVPLEDVWVTANFKETQLKNMRPGQRVEISVDAFGGRTFKGHVDSIAAATGEKFSLLPPENATGNYVKVVQRVPVKIVFENGQDPHHLLRPGMSVVPTVITR
jgi:membrane fusion protein, multidrug efflux system